MKPWDNVFKAVILAVAIVIVAFNVLLYKSFEQQKNQINVISDQQKVDSQINNNKFKYQQDLIGQLGKDLEDADNQIKDQTGVLTQQKTALAGQQDALLQEIEKRQQVENDNKSIQTSLVDIKAEADAIKENMKGWQKDYVAVLAEFEKKMDDSQAEMKSFENNFTALNIPELKENIDSLKTEIENMSRPPDNNLPSTTPTAENQVETIQNAAQ